MHGAGNDYIYVDTTRCPIEEPERLAIRWSRAHTGIGSDGLVLIGPSGKADFSMRIFNADGSEAMMCGNDTLSGIKLLSLHVGGDNRVRTVTVDMGRPVPLDAALTVETAAGTFRGMSISMGNPHFVVPVDRVEEVDLATVGPLIERHPAFPDRVNVEFVQVTGPGEVRMRVWERGSGITQACGTGACATAVACLTWGVTSGPTRVVMDGGSLTIEWDGEGPVRMTGGATLVFEGAIALENE